jgi:hypothetical protein
VLKYLKNDSLSRLNSTSANAIKNKPLLYNKYTNNLITFIDQMKIIVLITLSFTLLFCSPKGPVTYKSSFVGGTKADLVLAKGTATTVKTFDQTETYIYSHREDYYGKNFDFAKNVGALPKYTIRTEHIYYINEKGIVYKYQVWKKKTKPH